MSARRRSIPDDDYHYDNLGRKIEEIDPAVTVYPVGRRQRRNGRATTTFAYDPDGNHLSTTDPDGDTTWTDYDALNRAVKTVSAQGSGPNDTHYATTTAYDAVGNISSVTDPDGNVTSYVYDNLNRQIETIDPLHNTGFDVYDLDGNVIQSTDADGRMIQYVYDPLEPAGGRGLAGTPARRPSATRSTPTTTPTATRLA